MSRFSVVPAGFAVGVGAMFAAYLIGNQIVASAKTDALHDAEYPGSAAYARSIAAGGPLAKLQDVPSPTALVTFPSNKPFDTTASPARLSTLAESIQQPVPLEHYSNSLTLREALQVTSMSDQDYASRGKAMLAGLEAVAQAKANVAQRHMDRTNQDEAGRAVMFAGLLMPVGGAAIGRSLGGNKRR